MIARLRTLDVDRPGRRIVPAHQGFQPRQGAAVEPDFRLKEHVQLTVGERTLETFDKRRPRQRAHGSLLIARGPTAPC